ncbi:Cyclic AMP-dependent transcription factor [Trichinella spiralis]|uniref:Cyclic AMP-dependent transcription factor n=1 Tax=Trichinella spiralis TaxID=6334 RepID=A0ABR3K9M4_TRISP
MRGQPIFHLGILSHYLTITAFGRINMQDFNLLSGGLDDFCDLETDGLSSLDAFDLCSENDLKQLWCESDIQSFDNFLSLSDWEFSNKVDELLEGSVYAGNETKTGDFFDDEYKCDWNMSALNEEKRLNESVVAESCSADNNLSSINNHQPSPSECETLSKIDENNVKSVSDHNYRRNRSEKKSCDVGDVKRKRRMNKEAAQRYRQRKKMEKLALDAELESLEKRNVDLKASIKELNSHYVNVYYSLVWDGCRRKINLICEMPITLQEHIQAQDGVIRSIFPSSFLTRNRLGCAID